MKRTFRFYFCANSSKMRKFSIKNTRKKSIVFSRKSSIVIMPGFLGMVEKPKIVIAITGTNGKTTVSKLTTRLFKKLWL